MKTEPVSRGATSRWRARTPFPQATAIARAWGCATHALADAVAGYPAGWQQRLTTPDPTALTDQGTPVQVAGVERVPRR